MFVTFILDVAHVSKVESFLFVCFFVLLFLIPTHSYLHLICKIISISPRRCSGLLYFEWFVCLIAAISVLISHLFLNTS